MLTGDVLQFGVDVDSSPRAQTIPCVVCAIKCYLPDGTEVEPNPAGAIARESYSKVVYAHSALLTIIIGKLASSTKKAPRPAYNHDGNRSFVLYPNLKSALVEVRRMHDEATQKELVEHRSDIAKFHSYADVLEKKFNKLEVRSLSFSRTYSFTQIIYRVFYVI